MSIQGEQTRALAGGARPAKYVGTLLLFGATLFLSALLLFSVQPLFAKMVLPRLGGTPAVWSVAMVFFQAMLLAGYAYAHALVRFVGLARGLLVHVAVLAVAVFWLPFRIASGFNQPPESGVAFWLLALFFVSIGAPFFAVSANAPLLQAWFSRTRHRHAHDPYFLYGASNLGSFFALLSYPVLFEPAFGVGEQSQMWIAGYVALCAGVAVCGLNARSHADGWAGELQRGAAADAASRPAPTAASRLRWIALASVPSGLLVAVTAHISTNVAAAPFLWVVPLALYLLTFVITFQRRPILPHRWMRLSLPITVIAVLALLYGHIRLGIVAETAIHLTAFFVAAMVCHGELVARRPDASHLTEFYLSMSIGGVLGGAFTTLLSPLIFTTVLEYPLLVAAALLALPEMRAMIRHRPLVLVLFGMVAALALWTGSIRVLERDRSFFGVVTVSLTPDRAFRTLTHGTILHGAERSADVLTGSARPEPLTYFTPQGPIATAITGHRERLGRPMSVGIVGLGVGSLACYAAEGDKWHFYEIDPAVIRVATDPRYFTFLSACTPDAPIIVGDARLTVMREPDRSFDVLVMDAFSSDAVPVHLITREAIAGYFTKLVPGGIVVLNISNRYVELRSVLAAIADEENLAGAARVDLRGAEETRAMRTSSEAVVLARSPEDIWQFLDAGWEPLKTDPANPVRAWSDDYSNIVAAIMRHRERKPPSQGSTDGP
ncbi:MAG: fused MFS/spermidine synthase [Hyphomicrobiales bacterium]|nr:fused MFS/spermidine synthase [Hyphomicrobiales bacterium]